MLCGRLHPRESESLPIHEVGKAEIPLVITSASCDETARPNRESAEPNIELTSTMSIKSSGFETTEIKTRRKHMTDQRKSFNSEHNNYRKAANLCQFPETAFGIRSRTTLYARVGSAESHGGAWHCCNPNDGLSTGGSERGNTPGPPFFKH